MRIEFKSAQTLYYYTELESYVSPSYIRTWGGGVWERHCGNDIWIEVQDDDKCAEYEAAHQRAMAEFTDDSATAGSAIAMYLAFSESMDEEDAPIQHLGPFKIDKYTLPTVGDHMCHPLDSQAEPQAESQSQQNNAGEQYWEWTVKRRSLQYDNLGALQSVWLEVGKKWRIRPA